MRLTSFPNKKSQNGFISTIVPNTRLMRIAVATAFAAMTLGLAACNKAETGGAPPGGFPPPEVNVVTVAPRDLGMSFEYPGQTAGSQETEVRARISGIIDKRLYEEGSRVKAGAVLFQIDPANYQTQFASLEAAVAVSEAKWNQAKREYARLAPLAQEKAISQKELDDAKSNLESTEASLKQSRAQMAEAKLNLGYTRVIAPISGVTGVAAKSNGNLVTTTDSLLTTIVQTDPLYINFSVPEADFLKLNKEVGTGNLSVPSTRSSNGSIGFEVSLKLADGSVFPAMGKMNFVSERINPNTGGFDARAQVPNPDGSLRPGQFVRVILNGATRKAALAVPQRAVIDSQMGKLVFTVSPENKLVPKPVELDAWLNGEWVVTKGLQKGDRVMVDGVIKAHTPGMVVTPAVLDANTAAHPPQAAAPSAGTPPAKTAEPAKTGAH